MDLVQVFSPALCLPCLRNVLLLVALVVSCLFGLSHDGPRWTARINTDTRVVKLSVCEYQKQTGFCFLLIVGTVDKQR